MKNFDRILNIVLIIAVVLFAADYFLRDTDTIQDDFAPVTLNESASPDTSSRPIATPASSPADAGASVQEAKKVSMPAAYSPLNWDQLEAQAALSHEKPTLIFVFTSWCPFCKKMMPVMTDFAKTEKDRVNVLAISIDENPEALMRFAKGLNPKPPFPIYLHSSGNERAMVQAFLYKHQLNFSGGIPYMAYLSEGKPVQQFGGFVEKNILTDVLDRIERNKTVKNSGT